MNMLNPITTENAREKGEKIRPITHRHFYTRGFYISLGFLEKKNASVLLRSKNVATSFFSLLVAGFSQAKIPLSWS
jgi:hypothetical protein